MRRDIICNLTLALIILLLHVASAAAYIEEVDCNVHANNMYDQHWYSSFRMLLGKGEYSQAEMKCNSNHHHLQSTIGSITSQMPKLYKLWDAFNVRVTARYQLLDDVTVQRWCDSTERRLPPFQNKTKIIEFVVAIIANPALSFMRSITIYVFWRVFKVVLHVLSYPIVAIFRRCCVRKQHRSKEIIGRKVKLADEIPGGVLEEKSPRIVEYSLVKIFTVPHLDEQRPDVVGYIGVYVCNEADYGLCARHVPFVEEEHISLARSRINLSGTISSRPMTRGTTHVMRSQHAPVKVWSVKKSDGRLLTIDRLWFPFEVCRYSKMRLGYTAPVVDVYGSVYPSMFEYLCNSPPLTMPSVNEGRVVKNSAKHSQVVSCSDRACSMNVIPEGTKLLKWDGYNLKDIQQRTARLKEALQEMELEYRQASGMDSTDAVFDDSFNGPSWTKLVDTCTQYAGLIGQIDPSSSSSIFGWVKRIFGVIAFASTLGLSSFSSGPSSINGIDLDIARLTNNTNIKFGQPMTYDELKRVARPGDMIAVHGVHPMSKLICMIQSAIKNGEDFISHVTMIVDTTVFVMPGMVPGELYAYESGTGGGMIDDSYDVLPDVSVVAKTGVQIRSLRGQLHDSVKQNSLYMFCPLNEERRAIFDANVGVYRKNSSSPCAIVSNLHKYLNKRYTFTPSNFFLGSRNQNINGSIPADIARNLLTGHSLRNQTAIGSEYFCSELVGSLYIDAGVLKPNAIIPHQSHLRDHVSSEDIASGFYVGRQLYPLDYFLKHSCIPYLFDDIHVILPLEEDTA